MSDTTAIAPEERAEIRRRFEILRRGHPITGSFSLGVHMDGYLRNYAHGFEVNFIGLLDALDAVEAQLADAKKSGPIADNGKIAADKWNSLPRRPDYNDVDCAGCPERRRGYLTWTTEPPTVPGWYFLRSTWASGKWRGHGAVYVYFDKESQKLQLQGWGRTSDGVSNFGHYMDTKAPQWAGPIPEPLEPEES